MEALETAVVDRITADPNLPSQVAVSAWSDKPLKASIPSGNTAAIFVRYVALQKDATPTVNRGRLLQNGRVDIEVRFFVKTLREGNSAYDLMRFVEEALAAWLPTELETNYCAGLPGLQLVDEQLIGNDKTLWDWGQTYLLPVTYTKRSS